VCAIKSVVQVPAIALPST